MDGLRSVLSMSDEQMPEWRKICRVWAKKNNADLLFVDHESFGVERNGTFHHIYIDELVDLLKNEEQNKVLV